MYKKITTMSKKRPEGKAVQYVNQASLMHNYGISEYCRTSISALSGVVAGILGLTGWSGFLFYIFCACCLFLGLMLKSSSPKDDSSEGNQYFVKRMQLLWANQSGALFTYILSWTFLYSLVHVY